MDGRGEGGGRADARRWRRRALSDEWLGAEALLAVSFQGLILPERYPPHTQLLDLDPLPLSALGCPAYEALYRFSHFNPIQTQARPRVRPARAAAAAARCDCRPARLARGRAPVHQAARAHPNPKPNPFPTGDGRGRAQAFHTLYHTDENVLMGAPTGSGKTISAELAMLRVFRAHPGMKVIYIAPLTVRPGAARAARRWRRHASRHSPGRRRPRWVGDCASNAGALGLARNILTLLVRGGRWCASASRTGARACARRWASGWWS